MRGLPWKRTHLNAKFLLWCPWKLFFWEGGGDFFKTCPFYAFPWKLPLLGLCLKLSILWHPRKLSNLGHPLRVIPVRNQIGNQHWTFSKPLLFWSWAQVLHIFWKCTLFPNIRSHLWSQRIQWNCRNQTIIGLLTTNIFRSYDSDGKYNRNVFGQKSDDHMPRTTLFFFAKERVNFICKIIRTTCDLLLIFQSFATEIWPDTSLTVWTTYGT
jgi:hypothetical protein